MMQIIVNEKNRKSKLLNKKMGSAWGILFAKFNHFLEFFSDKFGNVYLMRIFAV